MTSTDLLDMPVESFADDPAWSTAVPDWEDRILSGRSLVPDLPLFDGPAEKALQVFKRLRIPDLIGNPTYGEVSGPWVFDFVRALFGSYNPATKRRMIREAFLLVPKKNAKSAIAAGIIVTAAILNERPEAECLLIAPTQEIAGICFKQAAGIVRLDPQLAILFKVQSHLKKITHRETLAEIKILSADGDVVTGSKATYILIDETHVLGAKTKAPEVFLELRGGLKSRPEGFLLQITTQSKDRPSGQFEKELSRARAVRDGKIALPMLSVLYELPEKMAEAEEWRDPKTWPLVNPNLGRSIHARDLAVDLRTAEEDGPEALALFASQHLNVQIGLGLKTGRWIGADYWRNAVQPGLGFKEILASSDVAVLGIDGGGLDDLLGAALLGRHRQTRCWQLWCKAWADRAALQKQRKKILPELDHLAKAGELTWVDNIEAEANPEIVQIALAIREAGLLPEQDGIGMDPEGVGSIIDALVDAGFEIEDIKAISQGYKLNAAIKTVPVKLKNGSMVHGGQRMMDWCVGNARTEARGNAVIVTKAQSGSAKIDPLMATFNAVQLMSWNPQAAGSGFLEYTGM